MVVMRELRKISADTSVQWKGRVGDHGSIHICYRWGMLTVRVSETSADAFENRPDRFRPGSR